MSRFIYCYAECRYAECRYAECRYAECRGIDTSGASFLQNLWTTLWVEPNQGIPTEGGRLSTVDLLIKTACFVTKVSNIFSIKSS